MCMKRKEKQELQSLSDSEFVKRKNDLEALLVKHNVNKYTKPSKNVRMGRTMRKIIAGINTVEQERKNAMKG